MNTDIPFSVVVTGEWPGSGQSTTATMLAKRLGFKRVYAGFLFRKFAKVWDMEKNNMTWEEFEKRFSSGKSSLDDYHFEESDFNEKVLHQWQFQLKSVNTPDVWDKIIDQQSLRALQQPGNVVEGKVGVLLDKTGLIKPFRVKHKVFKFLLTCPPEISTHRVMKRKIENGEMQPIDQDSETYQELIRSTTTETIGRHLRDWERYETIYGIKRSDVYKRGIHRIFTAERSEEEVVDAIEAIIKEKIGII
jgi:cytidylate kinase